jgi:hypothetical protein
MIVPDMAKSQSHLKYIIIFLYSISLIVFFYFLITGFGYYLSPYSERPHHFDYRTFRPAGQIGHGLGIIGSAMMVLMLTYTLRKRLRRWQKLGALSSWLNIHIYFGIMGPLLVILHTSFKIQGLVAVSFWSMIVVALSGVLGRYLYLQIPRNIEGGELSIKEINDLRNQDVTHWQAVYKLTDSQVQILQELINTQQTSEAGFFFMMLEPLKDDLWGVRRLKHRISGRLAEWNLPSSMKKDLWRSIRQKAKLERRVRYLTQMQRLFHYWHVIHKPFAIIMYLIMVIHIGVAIWLGYNWIF